MSGLASYFSVDPGLSSEIVDDPEIALDLDSMGLSGSVGQRDLQVYDLLHYCLCGCGVASDRAELVGGPAALVVPIASADAGAVGDLEVDDEAVFTFLAPDVLGGVVGFMEPITAEGLRNDFCFDQMMALLEPKQPQAKSQHRGLFGRLRAVVQSDSADDVYLLGEIGDVDDHFDAVWDGFKVVRDFYSSALGKGHGIIVRFGQ